MAPELTHTYTQTMAYTVSLVVSGTCDSDVLIRTNYIPVRSGDTVLYSYGIARLAQVEGSDADWFLGDALGSVRQTVDDDGSVVLARDYTLYGQVLSESGAGTSGYGFTGEQHARYLISDNRHFLRDLRTDAFEVLSADAFLARWQVDTL